MVGCVLVPGASWRFGDGAQWVLVWSRLWNGMGPAGCRPSGLCGAVGIWMHSSSLAVIKKHDP